MLGFLVWIAVPSGGGLLTSFAAGYPAAATSRQASAAAPPGEQAQLSSNPSDLSTPSLVSPGAAGITGDASLGSPSDDGTTGDGLTASSNAAPAPAGAPGGPGPTTTSPSCPASFPTTNTALDSVFGQLKALCAQLLGGGAGTVAVGSLPGGSGASANGASPRVPTQWLYLDAPVGARAAPNPPNPSWTPPLAAEMAGRSPSVLVGLVQGAPLSPALAAAVADLAHRGIPVQLLLVPQPDAPGGPPAFGSWTTQLLGVLQPVQLVQIGTGAPPPGSNAFTVASYTLAGLTAARHAPGRPTAGVSWLDGGAVTGDALVWSSLDGADAWSTSSFVARAFDAADACTSPAAFAATVSRDHAAAGLPVVSEAVQAPAPAARVAADYGCLEGSVVQGPAPSVAMWRLWEGPVPR